MNYFLADHLGSTNALTDPAGATVAQTEYDAFGNPTAPLPTRYGFTGRERDDAMVLMYYRARFYDPKLGRFTSEDPIGFAGGDVNLYGYVRNNSINRLDPMGLDDADIAFRDSDYYRELEKRGDDFWASVRNSPNAPECGPAGSPFLEWLVPDNAGNHNFTPPCVAHDACYSSCGTPKSQCDVQLGDDIRETCLRGGGSPLMCKFYGGAYYQGVNRFGGNAYRAAQEESGCRACSLPLSSPPRDRCANFGDWRCK